MSSQVFSQPTTPHRSPPPVVASQRRPTSRQRLVGAFTPMPPQPRRARQHFRPINGAGYSRRRPAVNRRGSGRRGPQGIMSRRRGIGQYPYAKRTNLPETKLKRVAPIEKQWETVEQNDMTFLPVKGETFVPQNYQYWNQGIGVSNVTGTQVILKNITGRLKIVFNNTSAHGQSIEPWNFRLITGFCKMGDFHSLEDSSALAVNPFPEGVVLNYAADTLEQHVTKVLRDSIGNNDGVLTSYGGIDARQVVVTGDERFVSRWQTQSQTSGAAGDDVVSARPNIIKQWNWNCNKRLKLFPTSPAATATTAAANYQYSPVNDPRPLIPFCIIMCTNVEDHTEVQAAMPELTFDSTAYWTDC